MALAEPFSPSVPTRVRGRVRSRARSCVGRIGRLDAAALIGLAAVTVVALLTPWIAPHEATTPAGPSFSKPFGRFLLGTDEVGRDVLSRTLYGMRTSWLAALLVIASGVLIGGLYAMFAAGLSLIFGVMRLVNIAHGDLIVLAAYIALVVTQTLGLDPLTSLLLVVPIIQRHRLWW